MNEMRPLTIQRRWFEGECGCCGAKVTIDRDGVEAPGPDEHEDDCPRGEMIDPR